LVEVLDKCNVFLYTYNIPNRRSDMGQSNKWERRDNKQNAKRKMKMDGAGNRVLQRIILKKADAA